MIPFDPWCYAIAFDWFADFYLWVLEVDGLSASPFAYHVGGDHTLQRAGLEAMSWHTWMRAMITTRDHRIYTLHHQCMQRADMLDQSWQEDESEREALFPDTSFYFKENPNRSSQGRGPFLAHSPSMPVSSLVICAFIGH